MEVRDFIATVAEVDFPEVLKLIGENNGKINGKSDEDGTIKFRATPEDAQEIARSPLLSGLREDEPVSPTP